MSTSINLHHVQSITIETRKITGDDPLCWTHITITDAEGNRTALSIHNEDNGIHTPITFTQG